MFGKFFKNRKFLKLPLMLLALLVVAPVWAGGPPAPNPLTNPFAILLISIMIILLIAIGILGGILIGTADVTLIKRKKEKETVKKPLVPQAAATLAFLLLGASLFAQTTNPTNAIAAASTIGGLSPSAFYILISIIFLELLVMLALLVNIRMLIKSQKESLIVGRPVAEVEPVVERKKKLSWWSRFNKLRSLEQEADIDLGHDYDGIRELDNRLPPWWIYGFYATIIFAAVYLWRYHVSHSAPLSKEEYEIAVQKADIKTKEYLKQKGETVDENTVTLLGAEGIAAGKKMFENSCIVCHNVGGAGNIGPNLTDDYWLHGGDLKSIFKTIKYGFNAMPTWQSTYSNQQIAQLASYVKSLHGTHPANPKAPQGELYQEEPSTSKPAADTAATKKETKVAFN